jgi:hypothetical protein
MEPCRSAPIEPQARAVCEGRNEQLDEEELGSFCRFAAEIRQAYEQLHGEELGTSRRIAAVIRETYEQLDGEELGAFCRFVAVIREAYEQAAQGGYVDIAEALEPVLAEPVRAFRLMVCGRGDGVWRRVDVVLEEIEATLTAEQRSTLAHGNRLEPCDAADRWEIRDLIVGACGEAQCMVRMPAAEPSAEPPSLAAALESGSVACAEVMRRVIPARGVTLPRARSSLLGGRRRPGARRGTCTSRAGPADDGASDPDPPNQAGQFRLIRAPAPASPGATKPTPLSPTGRCVLRHISDALAHWLIPGSTGSGGRSA